MLVRDLTRGIQDTKLPDMVPKPGNEPGTFRSALPNDHRSDLAPQPSTGYDPTHWQTGLLARNFTTRSAASIRRRRHLREELESSLREEQLIADQKQLITAQLEAHRRSDAIRRALREEENNAIALSSCSPRQPSSTASNSKQPSLDSSSPHQPQGRWIRPASTRTFFRTRTRRCSSTTSRLALSSPLSKGMFRPHPLSTYRQKITCSTRVHVLIPKLQTAETTRSTKLHRPRRLRPSSYTRRMPPPLQSLRLRPRSLSPANIPNNGQQTP